MPLGPGWHFQRSSALGKLKEHLTCRRLIVKFCRAGRLLRWLTTTFDVRGTVLLIRHPCAVVSSQLRHGGWNLDQLVQDIEGREAFGEISESLYKRHEEFLSSLSTRVEILAAMWCLDYYVPLFEHTSGADTSPWVLLPYERLVMQGRTELERMLNALGAVPSSSMVDHLQKPSYSAQGDLKTNPEQQLAKWKEHLPRQQIDTILGIVEEFSLSEIYGEHPEPKCDVEVL